MGVIGRRHTVAGGPVGQRQMAARKGAAAMSDSIEEALRRGYEPSAFKGSNRPEKRLSKISEDDSSLDAAESSGLDCKDIARLIKCLSSSDGGASRHQQRGKAIQMLVQFAERQQTLISTLQQANADLEQFYKRRSGCEKMKDEMNQLVRCSLQVSFSKLEAELAMKSGGNAEAARSIEKLHETMDSVLECAQAILRKQQLLVTESGFESADHRSTAATIEAAAAAPDNNLLCTYAEGRHQEEYSDLSNARLLSDGLTAKSKAKCRRRFSKSERRPLSKIRRAWIRAKDAVTSCFAPAVVVEEPSDVTKMEAHLCECKQLLRGVKLWLIHWQGVDAAFGGGAVGDGVDGGAGGAGAGLGEEDEPGSPAESCARNSALSTIATLLRKSETYAVDVVDKLLEENRGLGLQLERRHSEKEGLLRAVDDMNLKLLSSENKACQVAMEMLLMAH